MTRLALATLAVGLALTGCPERATPQRGTALTWRKPDGAWDLRPTVDRRLAQLSLKATLQEDARTLTVRVPEGGDVATIKALVQQRARLAFCTPDERAAKHWCDAPPAPGAVVKPDGDGCLLEAPAAQVLAATLADAGVAFVLGREAGRATAQPVEAPCLEPTLVAATVQAAVGAGTDVALQVQLDRRSARDFATLTERRLGRKLLVVLDDELLVAPVVQDAITGGKVMVLVHGGEADARLLAAALAGGPLPALELQREAPFGPPSLR